MEEWITFIVACSIAFPLIFLVWRTKPKGMPEIKCFAGCGKAIIQKGSYLGPAGQLRLAYTDYKCVDCWSKAFEEKWLIKLPPTKSSPQGGCGKGPIV